MGIPQPSIKAETLFFLGPIPFTNSMLMTLIVIAILLLVFGLGTRNMKLVPRGLQNFVEAIIELVLGLVEGTAGKRLGRRIFPLIATLFIFILAANWFSLFPGVGSITCPDCPLGQEHVAAAESTTGATTEGTSAEGTTAPAAQEAEHEEVIPWLRAPAADLNTTVAMALIAVFVVQISGILAHGIGGYLKELATPVFMTPIHVISEISRIISLSCRLFGNVFGGEVLLLVMYYLFGTIFLGFLNFIFVGLEVFFGLIQALLFPILTLNYITGMVGGHGDEHAAGHDVEHAPGDKALVHAEPSSTAQHTA